MTHFQMFMLSFDLNYLYGAEVSLLWRLSPKKFLTSFGQKITCLYCADLSLYLYDAEASLYLYGAEASLYLYDEFWAKIMTSFDLEFRPKTSTWRVNKWWRDD